MYSQVALNLDCFMRKRCSDQGGLPFTHHADNCPCSEIRPHQLIALCCAPAQMVMPMSNIQLTTQTVNGAAYCPAGVLPLCAVLHDCGLPARRGRHSLDGDAEQPAPVPVDPHHTERLQVCPPRPPHIISCNMCQEAHTSANLLMQDCCSR